MTCDGCQWAILVDEGYSNYTVTDTDLHCMRGLNPHLPYNVPILYDEPGWQAAIGVALQCPEFIAGEPEHLDADREGVDQQAPRTRCYLVTEETGEYSGKGWEVLAAFWTREAAERYAVNIGAAPSFSGESAGRPAVQEVAIWDDAPELVVRWNMQHMVNRREGLPPQNRRGPYRTPEYYPSGWTADLYSRIRVDGRENDWADIEVRAATERACQQEFERLLREWVESK